MSIIILGQGAPPSGYVALLGDAANAGTGGVSVVATPNKVNNALQFKSITAASARVVVADVPSTKNVSIDVSASGIDHQQLTGAGINNHAAIDARLPSADQKSALAGTSGVASNTNRYVTNEDARLIASSLQQAAATVVLLAAPVAFTVVPQTTLTALSGTTKSLVFFNCVFSTSSSGPVEFAIFSNASQDLSSLRELYSTGTQDQLIQLISAVDHVGAATFDVRVKCSSNVTIKSRTTIMQKVI